MRNAAMSTTTNRTAARADVPALRKGLQVLQTLGAEGSLSAADIQRRTGLNKTMTFRLLRALAEAGFVEQHPTSRAWSLGLGLLELGSLATARQDLVAVSQPLLGQLRERFAETVNLGVLRDDRIVYLAIAEGGYGLRMAVQLGASDPLHTTALGKAILAFMDERERDRILAAAPLARRTRHTITDLASLAAELSTTRARGYAIDDQENEIGASCVAAPIFDAYGHAIAAISISGPAARIDGDRTETLAHALIEAALAIGFRMGQSLPTATGKT
jgi:IclR family transcriptional regulator, acetate operon repressor